MSVDIHMWHKSLPAFQLNRECFICKGESRILVEEDLVKRWYNGEFIQDVFPHLTPEQRELMQTGTHPKCFSSLSERRYDP